MPKLFVATGIFHPESGGPATYLYHLLPHLQERGWEVRLLSYGTPQADDPERYPYPVTRIPRAALPVRMSQYAQAAMPLLQWADLTYVHSFMLPLWALPFSHKPRVMKVVGDPAWERSVRKRWITPQTDIDFFQMSRNRHPMVRWNKRNRRREVARRSDAIIVPSNYLKQMVTRWGAASSRVHVVYNALPPESHAVTVSPAEARAQLELHPTRPYILTAARLVAWKGIDNFIEALHAVPDVTLLVAGDGVEREKLERLAASVGVAERVQFLGRVPREDVALYMRAVDYVGLYSGYEGLSHVLLESLEAGTPVIASNKGGNPEVIQHGINGLLVRYKDSAALADVLRTAFADGQREKLAANTHINLDQFAYNHMVEHTHQVLTTYLNRRRA